jgi:hypothetical protein
VQPVRVASRSGSENSPPVQRGAADLAGAELQATASVNTASFTG